MDISTESPPRRVRFVAFDTWLQIAKTLNTAIALYRPTNPESVTGLEDGYAGFEQTVDEVHGWDLPSATLDTLFIFYLATTVLSHRLKTIKTLSTPTPPRVREQLASIQIISRFHSDREAAREEFDAACMILQDLRDRWPSADPLATLAQTISVELGKLPQLDLLHFDRSNELEKNHRLSRRQSLQAPHQRESEANGGAPGDDVLSAGQVEDDPQICHNQEIVELFGRMNDVSWMFLDAGNPVN
ncbi:hypothetical protein F4678DRAFT_486948 [Xylaria arbuscula]|nr:hypothetical protein F4678DRAFT_486948 [Xylaria arbuscula]